MLHVISASAPTLSIAEAHWLYAQTCILFGIPALLIYSSPVVREDDESYKPILDLLSDSHSELLVKEMVKDKDMMFGRAEWSVYLLHDRDIVPVDQPVHDLFASASVTAFSQKAWGDRG